VTKAIFGNAGDKFNSDRLKWHSQDRFLALMFFSLSGSQSGIEATLDIHRRTWRA